MKFTFEGTDVELLALKAAFADAPLFTKEMFMTALKDAMDGLKADLKSYVDNRDSADAALEARLATAVQNAKDAMDQLAALQANDATTIAALQAAKATLEQDVADALSEAADLRTQVAPPAVTPAPTTGGDAAGGTGTPSDSGSTPAA